MNKHIEKGNRILATAKNTTPYAVVSNRLDEIPTHFDGDDETVVAAEQAYRKALTDDLDEIQERIVLNRLSELRRGLVNTSIANHYHNETRLYAGHATSWYCAQDADLFHTVEYQESPAWMKLHWKRCKKRGTTDDKLLPRMRKWWSYGQKNASPEKWCEWNSMSQQSKKHAEITREIVKWSRDFFLGFNRQLR